jgi:hypothetical protein
MEGETRPMTPGTTADAMSVGELTADRVAAARVLAGVELAIAGLPQGSSAWWLSPAQLAYAGGLERLRHELEQAAEGLRHLDGLFEAATAAARASP